MGGPWRRLAAAVHPDAALCLAGVGLTISIVVFNLGLGTSSAAEGGVLVGSAFGICLRMGMLRVASRPEVAAWSATRSRRT